MSIYEGYFVKEFLYIAGLCLTHRHVLPSKFGIKQECLQGEELSYCTPNKQ